jgi:hypothetical protein
VRDMESDHESPPDTTAGYERTDVKARPVIVFLVILFASTVLVCVLLVGLFGFYRSMASRRDHPPTLAMGIQQQIVPPPRLQASPPREWDQMVKDQETALAGYRWINKEQGVGAIPIERAIDIIATTGMTSASAAVSSTTAGLHHQIPTESASGRGAERTLQ